MFLLEKAISKIGSKVTKQKLLLEEINNPRKRKEHLIWTCSESFEKSGIITKIRKDYHEKGT